jgi:hypothetical protein
LDRIGPIEHMADEAALNRSGTSRHDPRVAKVAPTAKRTNPGALSAPSPKANGITWNDNESRQETAGEQRKWIVTTPLSLLSCSIFLAKRPKKSGRQDGY